MCTNDCPGQPIGTYEVPLALSPIASGETLLNYRYDKATDELVISNYAPVHSGYFLTFDMKYFVSAYLVKDGYTRDFNATFKLAPSAANRKPIPPTT